MMKFCVLAANASFALALSETIFADDAVEEVSLIQLKALKVHADENIRQRTIFGDDAAADEETHQPPTWGCQNKGVTRNWWACGEWGDPHRYGTMGEKDDNTMQMGWHWLVKAKDGQNFIQAFLTRRGTSRPVIAALAGQFGGTTFKILKRNNDVKGLKLILNGEEQTPDSPTKTLADGFFIRPLQRGLRGGGSSNVAVCMDSGDARFSLRMDAYTWIGGQGGIPINLELLADGDDIDNAFPSFCTRDQPNQPYLVDPADVLVTPDEATELCRIEGVSDADCQSPPVLPPNPPVEQSCIDNGITLADAQAACESERTREGGMFEGCVEDCCASGVLADCATGPKDFDALVEEETDDTAAAVDDPHITNFHGHHYDMKR